MVITDKQGADLIAGSLIKNPGGTIAPCGGYVAGKEKWVNAAAARLSAPGLGVDCGSTPVSVIDLVVLVIDHVVLVVISLVKKCGFNVFLDMGNKGGFGGADLCLNVGIDAVVLVIDLLVSVVI
ncbi:putative protein YnbB [Artemisia annua]|uniref:Uncharacterized protein n=1 Tax=Artemisia annua TaxID=35608 RepID=A0A2U1LXJ8_ARTAN|nr:putative protein YnbB [Artemisia annua]